MKRTTYSIQEWKSHALNPKVMNAEAVDWIFVVDLLNFSFFNDPCEEKRYGITFEGVRYTGYWSLCAAVNRALAEGIPITKPEFYRNISIEKLKYIFRDDLIPSNEIPLLQKRLELLHEAGNVLTTKYDGTFLNCISKSESSAQKLLSLIVEEFGSFKDEHEFGGRKVYIYKRAQILIADLWACFEGKSFGKFDDISIITMFADYRVPQVLCGLGVLVYSDELQRVIANPNHSIESGSSLEVEIRGNSIWCVEKIRQEMETIDGDAPNAIILDYFLWDYAKANAHRLETIPIHRTRSIYY